MTHQHLTYRVEATGRGDYAVTEHGEHHAKVLHVGLTCAEAMDCAAALAGALMLGAAQAVGAMNAQAGRRWPGPPR